MERVLLQERTEGLDDREECETSLRQWLSQRWRGSISVEPLISRLFHYPVCFYSA